MSSFFPKSLSKPLRWTLLIGGALIVGATVLVATERRTG